MDLLARDDDIASAVHFPNITKGRYALDLRCSPSLQKKTVDNLYPHNFYSKLEYNTLIIILFDYFFTIS